MTVSRKNLIREFDELRSMEKQAASLYQDIIHLVDDPEDRKIIERLASDELRHSKMVQGMIDLLGK